MKGILVHFMARVSTITVCFYGLLVKKAYGWGNPTWFTRYSIVTARTTCNNRSDRSNVWSASPNSNNTNNAWNVSFNSGNANNTNRNNNNRVRLVRGGQWSC